MPKSQWQQLDERFLGVLHEAGEEDVTTLMNTVIPCVGTEDELDATVNALTKLVERALVDIEVWLSFTQRSAPHAGDEALQLIGRIGASVKWDPADRLWRWVAGERMQICLTRSGFALARKLIGERGWYGGG